MRKAFVIFFNLLISGLVVSFLFSCHRVKTPEEKCDSIKAVFRDSVVRLSFYGIELGASFTETMKKIKEVDNMSLYIDDSLNTCWGHVNIVTEKDESLQLNINITSYNDSIASIVLSTDDEDIANKVNYLYWQKYNIWYAEDKSYQSDFNGNTHIKHDKYMWIFKNQTLYADYRKKWEKFYYVKNPNMRSFENRYGTDYNVSFEDFEIVYSDIILSEKVEEQARIQEEKEKMEYERQQAIQDSVAAIQSRIEAEKKQKKIEKVLAPL